MPLQRQNCMETANIINLIVIVMTDKKKTEKKKKKKKPSPGSLTFMQWSLESLCRSMCCLSSCRCLLLIVDNLLLVLSSFLACHVVCWGCSVTLSTCTFSANVTAVIQASVYPGWRWKYNVNFQKLAITKNWFAKPKHDIVSNRLLCKRSHKEN